MTTHRVLDQSITMPVAVRDASAGRPHATGLGLPSEQVSTVWIEKTRGTEGGR